MNALAEIAPERYLVRAEERSYIVLVEEDGKESHPFFPDVSVTNIAAEEAQAEKSATAVAEPVLAGRAGRDARVHRRSSIARHLSRSTEDSPDQRLVTSIEVLSPSNKRPNTPGWDLYLRKRQSLLLGGSEPGGDRPAPRRPAHAHARSRGPKALTQLLVSRARHLSILQGLAGPFPVATCPSIPVPLAKPDPDIVLDLQPMIDVDLQALALRAKHRLQQSRSPRRSASGAAWLKKQLKASKA